MVAISPPTPFRSCRILQLSQILAAKIGPDHTLSALITRKLQLRVRMNPYLFSMHQWSRQRKTQSCNGWVEEALRRALLSTQGWLRYYGYFKAPHSGFLKTIPTVCVYSRGNEDIVKSAMVITTELDSNRVCMDSSPLKAFCGVRDLS